MSGTLTLKPKKPLKTFKKTKKPKNLKKFFKKLDFFSALSTTEAEVPTSRQDDVMDVEPCADVSISAAARRVILTGGGGAPIDFFRRRRRQ